MKEEVVLHILRNPYGHTEDEIRAAYTTGADLIVRYKEAYVNMRDWAAENGLDTAAYNQKDKSQGD